MQRQCWGESTAARETGKDYPLLATIPVAESVENQFDPCRHPKFFEDPIKVVPHRMFLNFKPLSDFAVLQAVGDEMDHFFLAARQ